MDPAPPRPARVPVIDASLRRGLYAVAISGGIFAAGGLVMLGPRTGLSVACGTVVALLNLVVLARVIRALLSDQSPGWILVGVAKMGGLFAGVGWLFHANVVGALPFVVGYASLPLGLAFAQTPLPPDDIPLNPPTSPCPSTRVSSPTCSRSSRRSRRTLTRSGRRC